MAAIFRTKPDSISCTPNPDLRSAMIETPLYQPESRHEATIVESAADWNAERHAPLSLDQRLWRFACRDVPGIFSPTALLAYFVLYLILVACLCIFAFSCGVTEQPQNSSA